MKKLGAIALLLLVGVLFTGFYETRWAEDNKRIWFIKHRPTLQVEFVNLFASDADDKPLSRLGDDELKEIKDYCFYRLGIETRLQTQAELEGCKAR